MKKLTLLTLLFACMFSIKAQVFPQETLTAYTMYSSKENLYKKYKVKEVHTTYSEKGKFKKGAEHLSRYDENGNYVYELRPKKDVEFHTTFIKDKMASRVKMKKGDTVYVYLYAYDEKGNWIKTLYYEKSLKNPQATTFREYNEKGKVVKQEELNHKNKSTYRFEYEYWENGSRKASRTYKKDKLQRSYSYECDMKGEIEKAKVNYCTKKSLNTDGSFVEIFETKKGNKVERTVYTYAADSSLLATERFNHKGILVWKSSYTYHPNKERATSTYFGKNGKLRYKYIYQYNDIGLLVQTEYFQNNKVEVRGITRNEYSFRGN